MTTDSSHKLPVSPNLLARNFTVPTPDTAWVADITYICTQEGWLYLAAVMDLYSRTIVGWDNAVMESFFHTLKTEHTYFEKYRSRAEARSKIFDYIEVFYNRKRKHSTLGYKSPLAFEEQLKAA